MGGPAPGMRDVSFGSGILAISLIIAIGMKWYYNLNIVQSITIFGVMFGILATLYKLYKL